MATPSTSPLFRLPLELRNTIYLDVILSVKPQPASPDVCRRTHFGIANPPNGNIGYQAVGYVPAETNSGQLLLVNRQVHAEVLALLELLRSQNKLGYELDVMIQNVGRLFATPRCFPVLVGHIPVLRMDFRFFGDYDLRQGCVALWGYSLTSFLNMFLSFSPDYVRLTSRGQKPRARISIGTLAINIVNPPKTPEWMVRVRVVLRPGEEAKDVEDIELRRRVVEREIDRLLDCRPRLVRDNHLMYERMDAVESWAGGQMRKRWVLADLAAASQG